MNKKVINEKTLFLKLFLCLIYIIVITILFVCSYKIFKSKDNVISWQNVKKTSDYSYIEISKMSEAFATYDDNKQFHFVIEREDTGLWHTYIIAIDKKDYNKYKAIIDYTYERVSDIPDPIKVYGYPVIVNDNLKQLSINNIKNFVPKENEVNITNENFNNYLTNSYMDTTLKRVDNFNFYLFITFFMMIFVIILFIFTCFYKEGTIMKIHNKLKKNGDVKFSGDKKYVLVRK